jgi:PAS domain S-box-containing protein
VLVVDGDPGAAERAAAGLEAADDRIDAEATTAGTVRDRLTAAPDPGSGSGSDSDPDPAAPDCLVVGDGLPDPADLLRAADEGAVPAVAFSSAASVPGAAVAAGVADYVRKGNEENAGPDRDSGSDSPSAYAALADAVVDAAADGRARRERERMIERHETILDALGDPVYALDADGRYTYVNDTHAEWTGCAREEIIGEHVSRVLPEESVRLGQEAIRELLASDGRSRATVEMERRVADGDTVLVENQITLLPPGPDGDYRGSAGVARDNSDRKARERELERRNRRFEAVFDNPAAFIGLLEPDGTTLRINRTARSFVGADPGDFAGVPFPETPFWSHDAALQDDLRGWIDRAADGDLVRFEAEHRAGDERVVIDGAVYPVTDETGTVTELVATGRDVTDRTERERELKRQNERLEEFASIVSHDLRNPLNVAEGRVDLARELLDGDGNGNGNGDGDDGGSGDGSATGHRDALEHLDAAGRAHDRMRTLIDDLLTMAEQGTAVDDPGPVDLGSLLTDCWVAIRSRDATLRVETDATVLADGPRLRQLFENLLGNSVEHGSTGSPPGDDDAAEAGSGVTVTVGLIGDDTHPRGFYVADDGPGIPEADRDRVFEPGYSTADDGTGFGLEIVREIAAAHGWEVTVTDADGGGARFEFGGVRTGEDGAGAGAEVGDGAFGGE